jgi:CubicO group peptidase (beta-lactamase class C family)
MQSHSLQEMIDKLAKIPLLYQPGTRWVYGASMDIQGYIVEKLSGQSLPDFMQQHIFGPLGMKDTGFFVPPEKRNRYATLYASGQNGELVVNPTPTDTHRRLCSAAIDALGRRRIGLNRRGLSALRADASERRRAGRRAHPGAGYGRAHDH